MNWTTIAVTAALLALQATILSLLHNGSAQAEVVYRCGTGDYRALPCHRAGEKSESRTFNDARTEAQLSQALSQRPKPDRGTATVDITARRHRARTSTSFTNTTRAIALSQHRSGMAPFHDGRDLSDSSVNQAAQRRHHAHRSQRAKPFVARVPKSDLQIGAMASETGWR